MATGLSFGLKLPTGDDSFSNFDPDTEIGNGSTDLLLGAYHMGRFSQNWNWFANAQLDQIVFSRAGYRPGSQIDAAFGAYYDDWAIGSVKIAPLAQIVGSYRWRDSGNLSDAADSGYQRLLVTPGVEFDAGPYRVYADVGFPIYQNVNGNQLVAGQLYKLNVSYGF